MSKYTNNNNIPLSLAVMLAYDDYDHDDQTISATTLIKPTKQIILSERVEADPTIEKTADVIGNAPSALGTAIHNHAEKAWLGGYQDALLSLGYPQHVIDKVVINPQGPVDPDALAIYLEQRSYKEVMGFKVSGKFDMVAEGRVRDIKTTGTYTYEKQTKAKQYKLQGSIYRWLNPDIIFDDYMSVDFFFTDWNKNNIYKPNYPKSKIMEQEIRLMSIPETETWIENKLSEYLEHRDNAVAMLPPCTDEDRWKGMPTYKYYANKNNTSGRSTKNFTVHHEALARLNKDGNKGIIKIVEDTPKGCLFCAGLPICDQGQQSLKNGEIKI